MIQEMVMPQLAMGMSEGIILEWLVAEGTKVERDAPVVSIETEKVVTELPAPYAGFLHIVADIKSTIPVEKPIAMIASTEDEYKQVLAQANKVGAQPPVAIEEAQEPAASEPDGAEGTPGGEAKGPIRASGRAKKMARDAGISLEDITGTGPGGRIVHNDVQAAIEARESDSIPTVIEEPTKAPGSEPTKAVGAGRRVKGTIPLTGMRGVIAERMLQAKLTAAQTYTFFEIDVTKLLAARATMLERQEKLGTRVSMIALYAKALALACQKVPVCNATLEGDEITLWENVDVGMAVAVPGRTEYASGLLVPVIRNVEAKSVLEISREIKDLVTRARSGKLSAEEMGNHTVTLSSTAGMSTPGSWSVSAPILNLPAVLAFQPGTPKRSCVVKDEQIEIRDILPCGLTFDHRAMDGEPIGEFGKLLADLLSNPELMLL